MVDRPRNSPGPWRKETTAVTLALDDLAVEILDLEVQLDELETRRLDLPVDAVAERITYRQTQMELESRLTALRRQLF